MNFKDVFKDPEGREPAEFENINRVSQLSAAETDIAADFEAARKWMSEGPVYKPEPFLMECENCARRFLGVPHGEGLILCPYCYRAYSWVSA